MSDRTPLVVEVRLDGSWLPLRTQRGLVTVRATDADLAGLVQEIANHEACPARVRVASGDVERAPATASYQRVPVGFVGRG